jgi:hypothetical protein
VDKDERKPPKKPIPNGPRPPFNHGILQINEALFTITSNRINW